jgi:hypothetical protein
MKLEMHRLHIVDNQSTGLSALFAGFVCAILVREGGQP